MNDVGCTVTAAAWTPGSGAEHHLSGWMHHLQRLPLLHHRPVHRQVEVSG